MGEEGDTEVRLYATLRAAAGRTHLSLQLDAPISARALIALLVSKAPELHGLILGEDGELREFVNVFVEGRSIRDLEGLDTWVRPRDKVAIFPAVAGGAGSTLEFRGPAGMADSGVPALGGGGRAGAGGLRARWMDRTGPRWLALGRRPAPARADARRG